MITPRGTVQTKVFLAFVFVTLLAAGLPLLISSGFLYEERLGEAKRQALAQASVLQHLYNAGLDQRRLGVLLEGIRESGARLTILAANGTVLHDSHLSDASLANLDDHNDRPEIEDARRTGSGVSIRHSNTLGIEAIYTAMALKNGDVLRLAVPMANLRRVCDEDISTLGISVAAVIAFCLLLSMGITWHIRGGIDSMAEMVADISRGMGKRRLFSVPGKEFLPLAYAVNRMSENIDNFVATTTDQQTQLEVILDSISEGILVFGPAGNIRRCNRAMLELFPGVAGAMGKQLIEAISAPILQRRLEELLRTPFPECRETDTGGRCGEAIHFESGGRFLVAHLSRPVRPNQSLGAVMIIYDATEIMRLERVRRDFVANVSHELRTPLSAITGYAETMMDMDDLDPTHKNFAAIIYKHAQILARVVSDLLNLARIEDSQENIPLSPVDPMAALKDAIALCAVQAEKKQASFVVEQTVDAKVMGNISFLAQVFRNLLENACRYSPNGGNIVITAAVRDKDMLFAVKDQGPGIPKEDLPRIFERLYQVKKQRNSGASGIGLAICKHIVERHGGSIWVESPYQGFSTAVLFTLPLADKGTV
jgi:two-component system phosphate regulon sensor histidine kinase PhoR